MTVASPTQPAAETFTRERLRSFLSAYWLRPENAYWMALRGIALAQAEFDRYDADLCCGDGIFSFLHLGGRFDADFDVFAAAGRLDEVTRRHADMFDVPADEYAPPILRRPEHAIDVGADLKPNLLAKAGALGLYSSLLQQDCNRRLAFDDHSLKRVYCNSAYWVTEIDSFLSELRRATRADGRIVLHVKLDAMRDYTLEHCRPRLGDAFLHILGRGRLDCWPTVGSRMEWEKRFRTAGLSFEAALPLATRTHAHIWDVGLRPIAPLLVRMANALTPATRAAIKRDWVEVLLELTEPMCRLDFELFAGRDEPAEIQYVLTPQ